MIPTCGTAYSERVTWFPLVPAAQGFSTRDTEVIRSGKEILTHTSLWIHLKDLMLSEKSQSQKHKCCTIPLIGGTHSSQIHGDRK